MVDVKHGADDGELQGETITLKNIHKMINTKMNVINRTMWQLCVNVKSLFWESWDAGKKTREAFDFPLAPQTPQAKPDITRLSRLKWLKLVCFHLLFFHTHQIALVYYFDSWITEEKRECFNTPITNQFPPNTEQYEVPMPSQNNRAHFKKSPSEGM